MPPVLHLRLTAAEDAVSGVEQRLLELDGVRRIVTTRQQGATDYVVTADIEPSSADMVVHLLGRLEVATEDYVLTRMEVVAPVRSDQRSLSRASAFAWVEVLGEARSNSRPLGRYMMLTALAGIIAGVGVVQDNPILIVGAMAVSPDLLPVCATCVGLADRRLGLARRSFTTLAIGLSLTTLTAFLLGGGLHLVDITPDGFSPDKAGFVASIANVDYGTVLVALAAGIAAILSFESRASSAVGVAISVTTVPAAAYFGVGMAIGDTQDALGALLVLGTNVVSMLLAGTLTILVQRRSANRSARRALQPG